MLGRLGSRSLALYRPRSRLEGGLLPGLQYLELAEWGDATLADLRDALEGCLGLTRLVCRDLRLKDTSTDVHPILMWSLQHIEISGPLNTISLTLAHILAPQCTRLEMTASPYVTADDWVSIAFSTLPMPTILDHILLIQRKRPADGGTIIIHCDHSRVLLQTPIGSTPHFSLAIEFSGLEKLLRWVRDILAPALPRHTFFLCLSRYTHLRWPRIANVLPDQHFLHGLEIQSHPDLNTIIEALSTPSIGRELGTIAWPLPNLRQLKLQDCDDLDPETLVRMIEARYGTETPAGSVVKLQRLFLRGVKMDEFALESIREILGRRRVICEEPITDGSV